MLVPRCTCIISILHITHESKIIRLTYADTRRAVVQYEVDRSKHVYRPFGDIVEKGMTFCNMLQLLMKPGYNTTLLN